MLNQGIFCRSFISVCQILKFTNCIAEEASAHTLKFLSNPVSFSAFLESAAFDFIQI